MAERAQRARRPRPKAWIDIEGARGVNGAWTFVPSIVLIRSTIPIMLVTVRIGSHCRLGCLHGLYSFVPGMPLGTITMISGVEVEELLTRDRLDKRLPAPVSHWTEGLCSLS